MVFWRDLKSLDESCYCRFQIGTFGMTKEQPPQHCPRGMTDGHQLLSWRCSSLYELFLELRFYDRLWQLHHGFLTGKLCKFYRHLVWLISTRLHRVSWPNVKWFTLPLTILTEPEVSVPRWHKKFQIPGEGRLRDFSDCVTENWSFGTLGGCWLFNVVDAFFLIQHQTISDGSNSQHRKKSTNRNHK